MTGRILIVDDEPAIIRALQPVLAAQGWQVFTADAALEGLRVARAQAVDLVLLDLGLPDLDGKEVIAGLRALGRIAVIVVSARHQEAEKIAALDLGADDYVDKPFSIDELMARVRAAQRRLEAGASASAVVAAGEVSIDLGQRKVSLAGDEVKVSPKEFELLRALAEHSGQVVTQRRLLLSGWGDPTADPQYLRTYIALLRQKLEADPSEPRIIVTEPGVGYRLNG
jgi:two-component system KDP operon response regulator KdpE